MLTLLLRSNTEEKEAVFIAERLEKEAFDVYMNLATDDKKDPVKVKEALINTFDKPKRNREVAIETLSHGRGYRRKLQKFLHTTLQNLLNTLILNSTLRHSVPCQKIIISEVYQPNYKRSYEKRKI